MADSQRESTLTLQKLKSDTQATKYLFNSIRKAHTTNEKKMKDNAEKISTKLFSMVSEYDANMMLKKDELEEGERM